MRIFYGWKISLLVLAGNFLVQGYELYCMNAYMQPLCQAYGWSRMELNFSMGLGVFTAMIAMPPAAAISQYYSLRKLMGFSALLAGICVCIMGFTSNIVIFTILNMTVWVASQFCGGVVGNALMGNWFYKLRGAALGLANSGTSLAGIFIPFSLMLPIDHVSIAAAFMSVGLCACALCPLSLWLIRRSPRSLGLYADGAASAPATISLPPMNTTFRSLLKNPAVWVIGFTFGFALMTSAAILSQFKPRFNDLGMSNNTAMLITSLSAIVGTLVKWFWGYICDKFSPVLATQGMMLVCASSMLASFLPANIFTTVLFCFGFTFGSGGIPVLMPAIVAYYFGSQNFLGVYKIIAFFLILRSAGFPLMGISYEYAGSYIMADIIFTCALFTGFVLSLTIRNSRAMEKH